MDARISCYSASERAHQSAKRTFTSVGQAASFLDAVLASRARSLTVSRESPSDEAAVDVHLEAFSSASTTSLLNRVPSCMPSMTCQQSLQLDHPCLQGIRVKNFVGFRSSVFSSGKPPGCQCKYVIETQENPLAVNADVSLRCWNARRRGSSGTETCPQENTGHLAIGDDCGDARLGSIPGRRDLGLHATAAHVAGAGEPEVVQDLGHERVNHPAADGRCLLSGHCSERPPP